MTNSSSDTSDAKAQLLAKFINHHYIIIATTALIATYTMQFFIKYDSYLQNDAVSQYYPMFRSIGHTIMHGHWVDITLQIMNGGYLLGGFQYGILNPSTIIASVVTYSVDKPYLSSFIIVQFFSLNLMTGFYVFLRGENVDRAWAAFFALAASTGNYYFYVEAASWWPSMIAHSWLPWAIWATRSAHFSKIAFIRSTVLTFLLVSSGWPHAILTLGIIVAATTLARIYQKEYNAAITCSLSALSGVLLVAPSIFALLSLSNVSMRTSGIAYNNSFTFNVFDIINISNPTHRGFVKEFKQEISLFPFSVSYISWLTLPLIPFIRWAEWRKIKYETYFWCFISAIFLLLSQGPDVLGPLRLPFRWIESFQICIIVAVSIIISKAGIDRHPSNEKLLAVTGIVLFSTAASVAHDPHNVITILIAGIFTLIAVSLFIAIYNWRKIVSFSYAVLISVLFVGFGRIQYPTWFGPASWGGLPMEISSRPSDLSTVPRTYTMLMDSWGGTQTPDRFKEAGPGNLGLLYGNSTINGYDSIQNNFFYHETCINIVGLQDNSCEGRSLAEINKSLFKKDDTFGVSRLDLLKVEKLVFYSNGINGIDIDKLINENSWILERHESYNILSRSLSEWLPGTVSFKESNISLDSIGHTSPHHERYNFYRTNNIPSRIVFSRLYYPGYIVRINDKAAQIVREQGGLMMVIIDGVQSGEIELEFQSDPNHLSLILIISTLLLNISYILFRYR